jgi:chaperonin GroEL
MIARNSGVYDISLLVEKILAKANSGYNFRTTVFVEDMIASGIIDPALVLIEAVSNATSVASSIFTMEVAIVDEPKKRFCRCRSQPNGRDGYDVGLVY